MDDPLKIIHKYKNNNRRTQYNVNIFIGLIDNVTMKILNKIKDINLYEALTTLSQSEYTNIKKKYGEYWYTKFYVTQHINLSINLIKETPVQKKEIIKKHGDKWYEEHINSSKLSWNKINYSYAKMVKDVNIKKISKKNRSTAHKEINYENYTSENTKDIITESVNKTYNNIFDELIENDKQMNESVQEGGGCDCKCHENDHDDNIMDNQYGGDISDNDDDNNGDGDVDNDVDNGDDVDDDGDIDMISTNDDIMDMNDIEEMYEEIDVEPDEKLVQTTTMIQKVLEDEMESNKKKFKMTEFDDSKDNDEYDDNLKNVFTKSYVVGQYIFKDDTIKTIKDKICCGLKNNNKFGKNAFITPSKQYLWSEYTYDDDIEKVMIGQKWIKRNELLHIDIEPSSKFRTFEELSGNLKLLRDNMRRGNKIKWENDENDILFDYENYFRNNEIYMIDVYNELGLKYSPNSETLNNISDVYMQLYFKKIKKGDIQHIIDFLNGDKKIEHLKNMTIYETINNDMLLKNEITNMVESVKINDSYTSLFKESYITQSIINVNLKLKNEDDTFNLYRIFNEFIPTEKYPFVQFQKPDGQIIFKFEENVIHESIKNNKENMDILSKWFENAPYGISFKIKTDDNGVKRFNAITLNDAGVINYKSRWKEDNGATIDDIQKTYSYVKTLIQKINDNKNRAEIIIPEDDEFRFMFINTIQKFELPKKFVINHNDLSEFSRFFFPYVSLVIEPRKRQAKIQKEDEKSKFGTYLRYRRVSKYDNPARIEQRIMYFLKNYEYNDKNLANEISKQFNTTDEKALEEIHKVQKKYPNLKKSRKTLKKLENIPRYKPPGINIDIQGKQRDKYKIRISGARNIEQFDRMTTFMNILIFLYMETYLLKKPERQILKEKLKQLSNIARRRNKVEQIVDHYSEQKNIKNMANADKRRIGFKPEKGQNQYSRSCQKSGDDKRRQPQQYTGSNINEMYKKGYVLNKKTGEYERKISIKGKNNKKEEITLRTIKMPNIDEDGNVGNDIHYTCDPKENGEHMYVGFLSKSANPFGYCMPCCYKIDPVTSKNKEKRDFHMKCLGHKIENNAEKKSEKNENKKLLDKINGEKLYILQDTNKIQEGRFGTLPLYLDFYFNSMLNLTIKKKSHYLLKSETGYFFKYGSKQDEYPFLNALCAIFDMSIEDMRQKIINTIENDTGEQLFTSLNNGDIRTQFGDRDKFINFIKYNNFLDYDTVNSILSSPKVLTTYGLNIIIFSKSTHIIKKALEKEKVEEDFYVNCQDIENIHDITHEERKTIFLLRENKNYYPIVMVLKNDEATKNMDLVRTFKYENNKKNIVHHVSDFFSRNCHKPFLDDIMHHSSSLMAKETYNILHGNTRDKTIKPRYQIIDVRNKCKFLITSNNTIIPVRPSGSIHNLQIIKTIDKYVLDFDTTLNNLKHIYSATNKMIPIKPIGVYYDKINDNDVNAIAIMTKTHDIIPIVEITIQKSKLKELNLIYENKPLYDKIDREINKGKNSATDERITSIGHNKFNTESYELFRLNFSKYLDMDDNAKTKHKIEKILTNKKYNYNEILQKISAVVYKIVDIKLYDIYMGHIQNVVDVTNDSNEVLVGGKPNKFVHIVKQLPNTTKYRVNNDRDVCSDLHEKQICHENLHCHWTHSGCLMQMTGDMAIEYVNRISIELSSKEIKAMEILKIGEYYVSDIVDYNRYTERQHQKIIQSNGSNIKKVLHDVFGKDNIPQIGKRRGQKNAEDETYEINISNQLKKMRDMYTQVIIPRNMTIFRAYVNGFYWLKNNYYNIGNRNLGYYSELQTDLSNYFKSIVTDWLVDLRNVDTIREKLINYTTIKVTSKNIAEQLIHKLVTNSEMHTNCIIELFILNQSQHVPIIVYNENNDVIYIFDDEIIDNKDNMNQVKIDEMLNKNNKFNAINLRFIFFTNQTIPDDIEVIYFKNYSKK